jgi:phenylalanyl-tRNA synthetase alpha chain
MIDAAAIDLLESRFGEDLAGARSERELLAIRDRYLGRKSGEISGLLKAVAAAPTEVRPELGKLVNSLKLRAERRIEEEIAKARATAPPADAVDITLPGRRPPLGHRHPLTVIHDELEAIFTRMGFAIVEGPETEDEFHCFDALNMPASHPARDMQDTLYLDRPLIADAWSPEGERSRLDRTNEAQRTLLRTHTSSIQIRYMEAHPPPVRIVGPGRVYRRDQFDLTHTPMFHQVEGLVVDEGISLAHLKGTLTTFARQLFGPRTPVRFRPSFFPYTEPSAELDIGCVKCGGSGCPMCKGTGWLEILGSGMVHPTVFEAVHYDAERYTGFAWGMGIERVALLRYAIDDIRLFYENDLRFLEQFPF